MGQQRGDDVISWAYGANTQKTPTAIAVGVGNGVWVGPTIIRCSSFAGTTRIRFGGLAVVRPRSQRYAHPWQPLG